MRFYPVPPVGGSWGVEGSYEVDQLGLQPLPLYGLNLSLRLAEGTPAHARLLRLGAVRSVVALHRRGFEDLVPTAAFASLFPEPILTYRVPGSLPRAYSVGRAHVSDGQAALQALLDPSFDPTRQVVLAGEGAAAAAEAGRGGRGGVRIEELFADRERLDVDLDRAGYVISVDAWDPGWRAWVDGKASPVLRANVAFRAVAVPAGRHVVELAYRPWSVLVGVTVTAGALLTSIGLGGVLYRRRRRRLKPASTSSADGPGGSACAGGSRPASPRPARRRR
jgi:hypothetical protein